MSDSFEMDNLESFNTDDIKDGINYPLPDLTYLNDIADNDEVFVKEIISLFLENCPVDSIDHFVIKAKKPASLGVRCDGCQPVHLFSESSGKTAMQPR